MAKQFAYFEITDGGMESFIASAIEDFEQLNGWQTDSCKEADDAMIEWVEKAQIGEMYEHRLGCIVRLKDTEIENNGAETKFTPGPWRNNNGVIRASCLHIASVEDTYRYDLGTGKPKTGQFSEFFANARLIAAAPDLYEALELLLSAHGQMEEKAIKMAKVALAKARGETNG